MKNISASDQKSLTRLASILPKGSVERRTILGELKKSATSKSQFIFWLLNKTKVVWDGGPEGNIYVYSVFFDTEAETEGSVRDKLLRAGAVRSGRQVVYDGVHISVLANYVEYKL